MRQCDRSGKLADTANFLLPASWTTTGDVTFYAEGSDYNGHSISTAASPLNLAFNPKKVPLYWVIQENNGTSNTPNLPTRRPSTHMKAMSELYSRCRM